MESGDTDEGLISTIVGNMRRDEIAGPHIQVRSFTSVDKGVARGVEAADFFAWHYNQNYYRLRVGGSGVPRKDFAAFLQEWEEQQGRRDFLDGLEAPSLSRVRRKKSLAEGATLRALL